MLGEKLREVPAGESGIYCMFDLDGNPAYVGRSTDLRDRLRQHVVRQDSSVVSYGRMDLWDLSRTDLWLFGDTETAEELLIDHYNPYLNFDESISDRQLDIELHPEKPDISIGLISSEERKYRSQPYHRAKRKFEHLSRMIDKIKLAGHSEDTKRTLLEHERILHENLAAFLDIDVADLSSDTV